MTIENYAVEFGAYGPDYQDAAAALGISQEGVFILSSLKDLVASGDYEGPISTPHEELLQIADTIEANGFPKGQEATFVKQLRFLAQFSLLQPIPVD